MHGRPPRVNPHSKESSWWHPLPSAASPRPPSPSSPLRRSSPSARGAPVWLRRSMCRRPSRWRRGPTPPRARPSRATDHVVIVSVDGLRPDAIARFGAKNIGRMMREGSHTLAATTISPSKTLPSHTSMLTGEGPEEHGITWNSNETHTHATVAIPTVFAVARAKGLRTAAFFSKGKFNHLEVPGSLDYTQAPNGNGKWSAKTHGRRRRALPREGASEPALRSHRRARLRGPPVRLDVVVLRARGASGRRCRGSPARGGGPGVRQGRVHGASSRRTTAATAAPTAARCART